MKARRTPKNVQAELAAIVQSSDDAIIGKDLDGVITSWNRGAERLYGYSAEEMIGRSIAVLMPPEAADDFPNIMQRLQRGDRVDHYETVRLAKDGTRLIVSLSVSPVRNRKGVVIGASAVARDITERIRTEEALLRSEKLAAAGRLAGTIAHEINNPLEAITNLIYLSLCDDSLSPTTRRYLETAQGEVQRVSRIARQTLSFYRNKDAPEEFSIRGLLSSLLLVLENRVHKKHVNLETQVRVSSDVLFGVEGDIRQIVLNLLSNSIDAVRSNGRVVVRISEARAWRRSGRRGIRISIADNGSGIEPHLTRKLFEPFYTTKAGHGTGLGLWVTRQIVQKHGGYIRVRSSTRKPRAGAVFSVVMPSVLISMPKADEIVRMAA